jgi:hypothetical protein
MASLLLALVLAFGLIGSASAATTKDVLPAPCILALPAVQTVLVGTPAKLTIAVRCTLPPQPLPDVKVRVAWGDGAISVYMYCMEVCRASIDASHSYQRIGDYMPSICLVFPTLVVNPPPCTSVEVKVLPPVA